MIHQGKVNLINTRFFKTIKKKTKKLREEVKNWENGYGNLHFCWLIAGLIYIYSFFFCNFAEGKENLAENGGDFLFMAV